MAKRRKKATASGMIAALLGFACAIVLGALFYGTMAYQLAGENTEAAAKAQQGGVLRLGSGTLDGETQTQETVGGRRCSVTTRTYTLEDGTQAKAVTAQPAAYLERLTAQGVQMQLITGFVIDGLDAVYALSGEAGMLTAREGDTVYMIEAQLDQQALYALGAAARREPAQEETP